jgi:hypothetical protein
MLVSIWGQRWRTVNLVMFTAYIDDSGTDPSQKIANATAIIVPAARIVTLEREWERLRKQEGFQSFHASELVARNPKSEFGTWDAGKCNRVFKRVRGICTKYGVQGMSMTVNKSDYDEVLPADFRKHSGMFHYTWAIRLLLSHLENWRTHKSPSLPFQFVFDYMGEKRKNPRRREIVDVMDQAEENAVAKGGAGTFSNYGFGRREEVPGLQCVDALAWTIYQYALFAFLKKPLNPEAAASMDHFGKYQSGTWGFDVTVTKEQLKTWFDKEIADGTSIKKFAAWREKRNAQART